MKRLNHMNFQPGEIWPSVCSQLGFDWFLCIYRTPGCIWDVLHESGADGCPL